MKQTINKREVKSTEEKGNGVGLSSTLQYYVGTGYVNRVKCVKQTINKREVKSIEEKGDGVGFSSTAQ